MNDHLNKVLRSFKFEGRLAPIFILVPYLVLGYVLFLIAPFDWVLTNPLFLTFYFCAILIVLYVGFQIRLLTTTFPSPTVSPKLVIFMGTLAALIVIIPTTLLYSGKYPWQFMELLADQSNAYSTYQERLANSNAADRAPIALVRALFHPFVFAVLPLVMLNWSKVGLVYKSCAFIAVACLLVTSLARGTDQENANFVIIVLCCWMVNYFRARNSQFFLTNKIPKKAPNKSRIIFLLSLFVVLMGVVFYFFVERKLGRYGGNFTKVCLGSDQDICLTNSAINMSWLGDWGIFALGITSSYMSAGYHGLSLAMDLDFNSTFGTGFSPMIARFYEVISGDSSMYLHSYTYRLRALGWSDEYVWSTLMIWFANDVGFYGALIVLFLLSMLFGASWRDAVLARDDRAAIVFVLLFLMIVYLPANNQIGQSIDLSVAFLFWFFRWQYMKVRRHSPLRYNA